MNNKKEYIYYEVENFLSKEECKIFIKELEKKSENDSKKNFLFTPINFSFSSIENMNIIWDKNKKIIELINFANNFFKENYEMIGTFGFNRIHGSFMLEESRFVGHTDDCKEDGTYADDKRTYVCGLYLNDDYEGGEFFFPDADASFIPKSGSLVLFPGWKSWHGIKPIKKGKRINILCIFYDILDPKFNDLVVVI